MTPWTVCIILGPLHQYDHAHPSSSCSSFSSILSHFVVGSLLQMDPEFSFTSSPCCWRHSLPRTHTNDFHIVSLKYAVPSTSILILTYPLTRQLPCEFVAFWSKRNIRKANRYSQFSNRTTTTTTTTKHLKKIRGSAYVNRSLKAVKRNFRLRLLHLRDSSASCNSIVFNSNREGAAFSDLWRQCFLRLFKFHAIACRNSYSTKSVLPSLQYILHIAHLQTRLGGHRDGVVAR